MKVNIFGSFIGSTSGYAIHTKGIANCLKKAGHDVHLITNLPVGWETRVSDDELAMIKSPHYKDGVTIAITLPNEWPMAMDNLQSKFCGYCVWEGSCVPRFWLEYFVDPRVDFIFVPSTHTRDAILNTFTDTYPEREWYETVRDKIKIIPHGIDPELFKPVESKLKNPNVTTILANKGWSKGINDRGGVQWLLKAFANEFKQGEPVELTIKVNTAYTTPGWNLDDEMRKLDLPPEHAKINFILDEYPMEKMAEFYAYGDIFCSPNMSEAFSFPILEAMACGLPIVTTPYGGQRDYCQPGSTIVAYELIENDWDLMYEGVKWALPDLKALQEALRKLVQDPALRTQLSVAGLVEAQNWTWQATAKKIKEVIDGSELRALFG